MAKKKPSPSLRPADAERLAAVLDAVGEIVRLTDSEPDGPRFDYAIPSPMIRRLKTARNLAFGTEVKVRELAKLEPESL